MQPSSGASHLEMGLQRAVLSLKVGSQGEIWALEEVLKRRLR
jgi:hypothetical protein